MLRCLMDMSVAEDSKCAKCCVHCEEQEMCEYRCHGIYEWETEDNISKNCIDCAEW